MFSSEDKNLFKQLKNPQFLVHAVVYWVKILAYVAFKRLASVFSINIYRFHYPNYLASNLETLNYERGFLKKLSCHFKKNPEVKRKDDSDLEMSIELATRKITCKGIPDWQQTFDDNEDIFALHRWGWLLMTAVNNPSPEIKQRGVEIMCDWVLTMHEKKDHCSWESYSISERIVNAIFFFYVLRDFDCNREDCYDLIESRLIDMGIYLAKHLEFRGELTNNHVINNARALYILGRLSSCEELAAIGRLIFLHETKKMITPSGFLREGSSNYQFILLRTYLEVLWAAELTKDNDLAGVIKPVAESMVKAAWTFNVYNYDKQMWEMPLIGDVSPDFPPEWINGISTSWPAMSLYKPRECDNDSQTGWNNIWNDEQITERSSTFKTKRKFVSRLFHDSGWYRADHGDFTIIWHINPFGSPPLYSHGHNDVCSFVLYWRGVQIITDTGRFSYTSDALGLYGKTARAHNTFILDGFEPFPAPKYLYPSKYREGYSRVDCESRADALRIKISHDGFCRINRELNASREIYIIKNSLNIKDHIQGAGRHNVKTFFHFNNNVVPVESTIENPWATYFKLNNSIIRLGYKMAGENVDKTIIIGQEIPETSGWYFPRYGQAVPIKTLTMDTTVNFPYLAEYSIDFQRK